MEGLLFVPPDRGTLIGRAVWKSRYVVLGPAQQKTPPGPASSSSTSHRLQAARNGLISAPRPLGDDSPQLNGDSQAWLTIYKHKGDVEMIAQYQVSTMKTCDIQTIQYRKPGPAVPTLLVTFNTMETTDKARKRRSSRTVGISTSSSFPNSILFRSAQEEPFNIYDWEMAIQAFMNTEAGTDPNAPMSPTSPRFNTFSNPFTGGYPKNTRPELQHSMTSSTYSSIHTLPERQRSQQSSALISPSPSLRSRRSDLSSQASSMHRLHGHQSQIQANFPTQSTPDASSSTSTAHEEQVVAGWTSAQGRTSSAVSHHTRGSNSVNLVPTPPAPTMSILDRAFQMRMIPGTEQAATEDSSQLSSIARFEALMRETDERINAGKRQAKINRASTLPNWGLDEDSEESDSDIDRPVTRARSEGLYLEKEKTTSEQADVEEMPTSAQRALDYIAGRDTPTTQRPAASRTTSAQRVTRAHALSTSAVPPPMPRSMSSDLPPLTRPRLTPRKSRPVSMANSLKAFHETSSNTPTTLKRRSSSSAKRQSFGEHAKRTSSGSSLLIVQGNQSDDSDDEALGSESEYGDGDMHSSSRIRAMHRGLSQSRLSGITNPTLVAKVISAEETKAKKNQWRGSGFGASAFGALDQESS